ncbi:hypothetical protein PGB90_006092 [Kerria lacca]
MIALNEVISEDYHDGPETVTDLELKADTSVSLEIQFQLNRIPFCESHRAVNCVSDYRHYISGLLRYSRNTKNVTGKTFTLARAVIRILWEKDTKILIFTRSNSAADFYIKEYLHPYVESGLIDATPLRIYYRYMEEQQLRWKTIHGLFLHAKTKWEDEVAVKLLCTGGSLTTTLDFKIKLSSDLCRALLVVEERFTYGLHEYPEIYFRDK